MVTINRKYLPIKIHWFLFKASMGPIVTQITLIGKDLGIGADVIGIMISIIPIFYLFTKILVGYLTDRFTQYRRLIFMAVILFTSLSFSSVYFLPRSQVNINETIHNSDMNITFSNDTIHTFQYNSFPFYLYAFALCFGTIFFQVTNTIGDAICFDMLGDDKLKYGFQRAFGAIGFGSSALLSGFLNDYYSTESYKTITPGTIITIILCLLNVINATQLKLPKLIKNESIIRDVGSVLRQPKIVIFLVFTLLAGIVESCVQYMFWHLEDVANETGFRNSIKLIEGCVLFTASFFGDILFMSISEKIIQKIGYVHCFSMCLFAYSARFVLTSLLTNPWYLVFIEILFRGSSSSLVYISIVSYASSVSPSGTVGTIQGFVNGTYAGLGSFFGASIGGHIFKIFKGKLSFRYFSIFAFIVGGIHIFSRSGHKKNSTIKNTIEYNLPIEQHKIEVVKNSKTNGSDQN